MDLVSCPRCGAQFDVSSFAPGSSFQCGSCQNVLQVPAAGAAPATPPAKGPGRPAGTGSPLKAKRARVDPRRAGDAGADASGPGRAERLRQQRAEGGEKRKNPIPLVAALAGAAILAAAGILHFAGKGEEKGPGGAVPERTPDAKGLPGSAGAAPPSGEKTWADMSDARKLAVIETKVKEASRSPEQARESWQWLTDKGLREDADRALARAHESFPRDPWILDQLGLVDRTADIQRIAGDEMVLFNVPNENPDLLFVLGLKEKVDKDPLAGFLTLVDSEALTVSIGKLKDLVEKMEDPVFQRTQREYTNLRGNPAFTGTEFSFQSYRPYVVFAEHPGPGKKSEADRVVRLTGETLENLYRTWLEVMRAELGLKPKTLEELDDDRFRVFVFRNRESFDAWHTRNNFPNPGPGVAAYYQHGRDRMILMHLDAFDAGIVRHEGTHQIIHYYARHFTQAEDDAIADREGKPREEVRFGDSRLDSAFFWFQEGIAEYFRGSRVEDGKLLLGEPLTGRLGFFGYMQKQGKLWPVEDFLYADQSGIYAGSRARGGGLEKDELRNLMYCQGWMLVHYCMHGDGGKWKKPFLEFVRQELSGKSGRPYLLRAFGLPERSSDPKVKEWMQVVESGYLKHFQKLAEGL